MSDNMAIWNANQSIDDRFIRSAKMQGQDIKTFSLASVVMMATKQFGPIGKGWGYTVEDERDDIGAVIKDATSYKDKDGNDVHVSEVREVTHTLIIKVWYMLDGERIEMPVQAGHTPKMMRTKYGPSFDGEFYKKTLADAIKKSLSMLGFGAEIFLGLMDDPHYLAMKEEEKQLQFQANKSSYIQELIDKVNRFCEAYKANTVGPSIKAQFEGHRAEVYRECKRLGENPDGYVNKLEAAAKHRIEEIKASKGA